MPAFLTRDAMDEWLWPGNLTDVDQAEATLAMLRSTSGSLASTLVSYDVDPRLNNTRTVDSFDPSLLEPIPGQ